MPPSTSQRQAIAQFVAFTGTNDKIAVSYLKRTGYSLEAATDVYFATHGNPAASTAKFEQKLGELFEEYRDQDADEKDTMGMESTMTYLNAIGAPVEDASMFIPLEIVKSEGLGEISKKSFIEGWKNASSSSAALDSIKAQEQYIQAQKQLMATDKTYFKKVYRHTFMSSKDKGQKALPLENAIVYWGMLFDGAGPGQPWKTSTTDWLELWKSYLNEKWTKSVNKDMWNQTFEFYLKSIEDDSLSFWSEDSAWPGVIDEFVAYVNKERSAGGNKMETD